MGYMAKSSFSKFLIPYFVKTYDIRTDEAEKQLDEYKSLNDFFIRKLKPASRPINQDPNVIISPVDGTLTAFGTISNGTIFNIKGQNYDVKQLLNNSPRTVNYEQGYYFILYLSPSDYHRIHSPITAKIVEKDYIPGRRFPVNAFGLNRVSKVLSRNERKITYFHHPYGEVALIKIGALNISSICYEESLQSEVCKGDPLAYFEFGSTVVLLLEKDMFEFHSSLRTDQQVFMGQALGYMHCKTKR